MAIGIPAYTLLRGLVAVVFLYSVINLNAGASLLRRFFRHASADSSSRVSSGMRAVSSHRPAAVAAFTPLSLAPVDAVSLAVSADPRGWSREERMERIWSCPFPRKRISCRLRERVIDQLRSDSMRVCLWDGNSNMHADRISSEMPGVLFAWDRACDITRRPDALFGMGSYWPGWFIDQLNAFPRDEAYKILFCTEPPIVQPEMYEKVREIKGDFDLTLTLADESVVNNTGGGNVQQWSFGSSHVPLDRWGAYEKTRLCSIIASKQDWAPGHKMRHAAIAMIAARGLDCEPLGKGYKYLQEKIDGLRDYRFSIVIENSVSGRYMTEKIIDAIATATVPVYWGAPYAKEVFGDAIITFSSVDDLERILPTLTPELYDRMRPAVLAKVDIAKQFVPPERWLFRNVFECAYRWHAANGDCKTDEEFEAGSV